MDLDLHKRVAPRAREICGLVDQMDRAVERSRKAGVMDFDLAEDLAAMFDRARSLTIDYLHTVGRAEGREPYLLRIEEAVS